MLSLVLIKKQRYLFGPLMESRFCSVGHYPIRAKAKSEMRSEGMLPDFL